MPDPRRRAAFLAAMLAIAGPVAQATPACGEGLLLRSGMEALEPAQASGGASDLATGPRTLAFQPPDGGAPRAYHVFVPEAYSPAAAWPLVVALHGAPGSPALADAAAQAVRDAWAARAAADGFLVLAPVASGPAAGGWLASDEALVLAAIADLEARYNLDRRRRYLWGFSAGGHFGYGLVLRRADAFAAYAVNAGVLAAYAGTAAPAAAGCRVPLSVRVGAADAAGLLAAARADREVFDAAGWAAGVDRQYVEFAGGHVHSAADIDAHWAWFAPRQRP
jgi:poly(3-hydroxybutyrate) depolymerase